MSNLMRLWIGLVITLMTALITIWWVYEFPDYRTTTAVVLVLTAIGVVFWACACQQGMSLSEAWTGFSDIIRKWGGEAAKSVKEAQADTEQKRPKSAVAAERTARHQEKTNEGIWAKGEELLSRVSTENIWKCARGVSAVAVVIIGIVNQISGVWTVYAVLLPLSCLSGPVLCRKRMSREAERRLAFAALGGGVLAGFQGMSGITYGESAGLAGSLILLLSFAPWRWYRQ